MEDLRAERYNEANKPAWDDFVSRLEAHSILFYRDFMEYHSDRFVDYSLMIFQEKKLIAIFPANIDTNNNIHSHQGLSYGGIQFNSKTLFETRLKVYREVLLFLFKNTISTVHLKSIPRCYSADSSNDLIFQWLKGVCFRTDIYSYIPKAHYKNPNRNRTRHVKNALAVNIKIRKTDAYSEFWNKILIPNLKQRFGAYPVHTIEEIERLAAQLQNQICFYGAYQKNILRAGVVLFIHRDVVHAQYSAGDNNRDDGSLDLLLDFVIKKYNPEKVFSFGTSSEEFGSRLNKGLLYWKESFRSCNDIQPFYSIETKNYYLLENRLR